MLINIFVSIFLSNYSIQKGIHKCLNLNICTIKDEFIIFKHFNYIKEVVAKHLCLATRFFSSKWNIKLRMGSGLETRHCLSPVFGLILTNINSYCTPEYLCHLQRIWILIVMMSCIYHCFMIWIVLDQAHILEEHHRQYPDKMMRFPSFTNCFCF